MLRKICFIALVSMLFLVFGTTIGVKSESLPDNCPSVFIYPEGLQNVSVGETFTVSVVVSDLVNDDLYGFDLEFKWNSAALKYIDHVVNVPVENFSEGVLHEPVFKVKDEVDSSAGTYWLVYASLWPAEPFNGNGVFFTITFEVLELVDDPFTLEYVTLVSYYGEVIPINGWQDSEPSSPTIPGSPGVNELWAEKWLEYWITVTFRRG